MSTYQHNCNSDYRNEGWSFTGSGVNECWRAWSSIGDDTKYCSNPSSKGRACVQFPVDLNTSAIPDGALITSVTLTIRFKKTDSASRPVTVNFMSKDDTSRYTSRTLYPTTSITTQTVGTFTHDALGFTWTKDRLDRIMVQAFSTCGTASVVNVYELYAVVNFSARPTVKVNSPTGSVTSPPIFNWTYAQTDGDPQKAAAYKVYTAATQESRTFDPNSTPSLQVGNSTYTVVTGDTLWDIATGKLGDPRYWIDIYNANLSTIGSNPDLIYPGQVLNIPGLNRVNGDITTVTAFTLAPGDYYVYVQAESSRGALSEWSGRAFSISGSAPGVPGGGTGTGSDGTGAGGGGGFESVLVDPIYSSVQLEFRDGSNLLSSQQADTDTDATIDSLSWNGSNCAVSQDNTVSYTGGASIKLVASSAADMSAATAPIEISPSAPVTARAQFYSPVTARTASIAIRFYDDAFVFMSELANTATETVGSWTEVVVTGSVPTGAVYAKVSLKILAPANAEVHNIDRVGLMYGSNAAWSSGGHASRNILSGLASQASDAATVPYTPNQATTVAAAAATGTGADGPRMFSMTYAGLSPSISFVATGTAYTDATTSSGFTLNKPAGVIDGDLLVAYVSADIATPAPAPTGWVVLNSKTAGSGTTASSLTIMMRDALTADPSTWVGDFIANHTRCRTTVVAYRGAAPAATQLANNSIAGGNTGVYAGLVPTTPALSNVDPNAWRLSAFAVRDDAAGGTMTANIAAPSGPANISYVGKGATYKGGGSTSYTVYRPSGVTSGDLMISAASFSGNLSTVTAPTGWTIKRVLRSTGTYPSTGVIMVRQAGASEPASWTGSLSFGAFSAMSQTVAYRGADLASNQFIAENAAAGETASPSTPTVTNTDSRAWSIRVFMGLVNGTSTMSSSGGVERADDTNGSDSPSINQAIYDSNATISTGPHQSSASISNFNEVNSTTAWIGIIKPATSGVSPGANETKRQDATAGSSVEWLTLAVFGSASAAATGSNKVYGSFTPGSGTSVLSSIGWIGYLAPAAPTVAGDAGVTLTTPIDITALNPTVLTRAGNQMTVQAALSGSVAGSSYLVFNAYVGNELKSSQTADGGAFGVNGTDPWAKSVATFPLPDGTTRVSLGITVPNLNVADVVYFDRVSLSFGNSQVWRPGTGRQQHPVFNIPLMEYSEDTGTGYGEWKTLFGSDKANLTYDQLSGLGSYTDQSITPLAYRKYRIRTVSYGLAGETFTSDYGPESAEAYLEAPDSWWLKDLAVPDFSMPLTVMAENITATTKDSSTIFQPVGEDLPIVVTQGYKGETVVLRVKCTSLEYVQLKRLLNAGRTLFLQSDADKSWWVRPQGDVAADLLPSYQHKTKPVRIVNCTFIEVAPDEGG